MVQTSSNAMRRARTNVGAFYATTTSRTKKVSGCYRDRQTAHNWRPSRPYDSSGGRQRTSRTSMRGWRASPKDWRRHDVRWSRGSAPLGRSTRTTPWPNTLPPTRAESTSGERAESVLSQFTVPWVPPQDSVASCRDLLRLEVAELGPGYEVESRTQELEFVKSRISTRDTPTSKQNTSRWWSTARGWPPGCTAIRIG